jgi:hypothetical protein
VYERGETIRFSPGSSITETTTPAERCYITYCSHRKNTAAGPMPAIERYTADRIRRVRDLADADGAGFLIFSGKFGMLRPSDPIPHYDHKLRPDEIPQMVLKISGPIGTYDEIVFFRDPKDEIAAYLEAVQMAAERVAVNLEIRGLSPPEPPGKNPSA